MRNGKEGRLVVTMLSACHFKAHLPFTGTGTAATSTGMLSFLQFEPHSTLAMKWYTTGCHSSVTMPTLEPVVLHSSLFVQCEEPLVSVMLYCCVWS